MVNTGTHIKVRPGDSTGFKQDAINELKGATECKVEGK